MSATARPAPQALLLIDLQNDFFVAEPLKERRPELVAACNRAIELAREAGVPVIEVRTIHSPDQSSWALNMLEDGQGMTLEDSEGAAPIDGLDNTDTIVLEKVRDSAFHGTRLAELLRERGVSSFALCGVSTESCISMTASDAYADDFYVTLIGDATGAADPDDHQRWLDHLATQYRQPVVTSKEVRFCAVDHA